MLHAKTRKSDTAFSTKANVIKLKLQKHALIRAENALTRMKLMQLLHANHQIQYALTSVSVDIVIDAVTKTRVEPELAYHNRERELHLLWKMAYSTMGKRFLLDYSNIMERFLSK